MPAPIRRTFFGYRRRDVDARLAEARRALDVAEEEVVQAREAADLTAPLGRHLATMLVRFAESVDAGEAEALEKASRIVTDAETKAAFIEGQARELLQQARDLAAATYAEAGRRYEAAIAARRVASEQIENAIESMADALVTIKAMPDFPELVLPVPTVDPVTNVVSFLPARPAPQTAATAIDEVDLDESSRLLSAEL